MKVLHHLTLVSLLCVSTLTANAKITKTDYIEQWKKVAVEQMHSHGIPASITLAQGILESSYGNSDLAQNANNHFGIKCHNWQGDKVYHDDDKKNECFRKYTHAMASFEDHSLFLTGRSRYADLFNNKVTDYKSWAKGLRKAGYATNPKYPQLLIKIIEDNELYLLDREEKNTPIVDDQILVRVVEKNNTEETRVIEISESKNYNTHTVKVNTQKTKYVLAKSGDTYYRLAKEYNVSLKQMYKYNDVIGKNNVIKPGDKVYVMRKRFRSKNESTFTVVEPMTLRDISQAKGIRLKRLMKMNEGIVPSEILKAGQVVVLR